MKAPTLLDYARRIDRALVYLTKELESGSAPDLEDLAKAAFMSKYHFHRIFRLMTGETVNEVVRRARLAKGVAAAARHASVTEGAGEAAYATSQAFARAMRSSTGMSVTQAVQRDNIMALFEQSEAGSPLSISLTSIDPLEVIAIRNVGDYSDLDVVFGRLFEIAGGPEVVRGIYGMYHDDPETVPASQCTFDAALDLTSLPADLGEARLTTVGGGPFLSLRHFGDYDHISLALDEITLRALVAGLELRDSPLLVHYLDDPEETADPELRADIYLPVVAPRSC